MNDDTSNIVPLNIPQPDTSSYSTTDHLKIIEETEYNLSDSDHDLSISSTQPVT